MSDCCSSNKKSCSSENTLEPQNHPTEDGCCGSDEQRFDYLLWGTLVPVIGFYLLHLSGVSLFLPINQMGHAVFELMNTMAWGLVLGVFMVAVLSYVPREFVISILGTNNGVRGLLRATAAGLLLDLCSHGILMVGAKLYERGASTGQVMAFLIASPWNSLSLTIILVALIGLQWTLIFILLSAVVAVVTGYIFELCVRKKLLPENPHKTDLPEDFHFWREAKQGLLRLRFSWSGAGRFCVTGIKESRMVIRWLMVGVILASLIRTFIPEDYFGTYFGPTILGLGVTLIVATVLEVCSEGSTPIAADIFNRAHAPGNSFAFLMTGVSTDYTEIMVIKERMRSWKIALFLPLISVPQVVIWAFILNA